MHKEENNTSRGRELQEQRGEKVHRNQDLADIGAVALDPSASAPSRTRPPDRWRRAGGAASPPGTQAAAQSLFLRVVPPPVQGSSIPFPLGEESRIARDRDFERERERDGAGGVNEKRENIFLVISQLDL